MYALIINQDPTRLKFYSYRMTLHVHKEINYFLCLGKANEIWIVFAIFRFISSRLNINQFEKMVNTIPFRLIQQDSAINSLRAANKI